MINNVNRYLNRTLKFEFTTFTKLHEIFKEHHDFNKVYRGDMLVYDEQKGDIWSGFFGSKPNFKCHIKRIFGRYRATENLAFIIQVEFEKLKTTKLDSPHL